MNRAQVLFSDEEVFLLSHIDETWNEPRRYPGTSILEHEMACQRDMRVRGKRLWSYHERLGDLADYFVFPRHGPPGIGYLFERTPTPAMSIQ